MLDLKRQIGLFSSILLIIADVIGTGIFVTTGIVLGIIKNTLSALILWFLGGVIAISGSLSYAKLATIWPEDGGEYIYIKKIFGLLPSFLTGWVSLIAGFSASAAISSMTLIWYFNEFFKFDALHNIIIQKLCAGLIILIFGFVHVIGVRRGTIIQNFFTIIKIIIIFTFIIFGLYYTNWNNLNYLIIDNNSCEKTSIFDYGFALLIITFAYSGWNGISYIAGELRNPVKNLPKAMFSGALLITIVYLILNIIFLTSAPGHILINQKAIGIVAAEYLFSKEITVFIFLSISLILFSSVSAQIILGSRLYYAMAKDKTIFGFLSKISPRFRTPYFAIMIQVSIAVFYVFIGMQNIELLLGYIGFLLGIFPLLTVAGIIIITVRKRIPKTLDNIRLSAGIPAIYIILTLAVLITTFIKQMKTSIIAIGVIVIGSIIFLLWQKYIKLKYTSIN